MADANNPLIPAAYDITWSVAAVAVIALAIIALISLIRSGGRLPALAAAIWALVILAVPVLGPVAWLAVGRRSIRPGPSTDGALHTSPRSGDSAEAGRFAPEAS